MVSFAAYWSEIRGYSRALQLFFISDILLAFTMSAWGLLFNLHLLALGYTAADIGLLGAVSFGATAVLAVPLGFLADRIGRQRIYAIGGWVHSLALLSAIWTRNFALLLALNALMQVGFVALLVGEQPILAGEVPTGRNAMLLSVMFINFFAWNTIGTLLAGYLPQWLPYGVHTHYQTALTIAAVFGLASALVRSYMRPKAGGRTVERIRLLPSRHVLRWAIVGVLWVGPYTLLQNFGNVILERRYHLGSGNIGLITAVGLLVSILASWFAPGLAERWGQRSVIMGAGLSMALTMWVGGLAAPLSGFLTVFLARNAIGMVRNPVGGAFSMESVSPAERTTMTSYTQVASAVGQALAAQVFGDLLAAGSYSLPFFIAAASTLVSTAAFYAFFGIREPKRAA